MNPLPELPIAATGPGTGTEPAVARRRRWLVTGALTLALVVAMVVAACGGDTDDGASTSGATPVAVDDGGAGSGDAGSGDSGGVVDGRPGDAVDVGSVGGAVAAELALAEEVGPWEVGHRTIEVVDDARGGRSFSVDLWYPVEPGASDSFEPTDYTFIPGVGYTSEVSVAGAPPAGGPFPLVVYSHGSGGFRWVATFFTEFLASRGFVVAAPDHTGNTATDRFAGTEVDMEVTAVNRPGDVTVTIDTLLAPGDGADEGFANVIDADRIAVTGHSFGGFTALASVAGYAGADGETPADPRVGVVVAMAPFSIPLADSELERVDVPTLVISATDDTTTPIATNTERVWDLVAGRPLLRIDLDGAVHNSFTDLCDLAVRVGAEPTVPDAIVDALNAAAGDACSDDVLDYSEVLRLTNAYAAAFLLTELADSDDYGLLLSCGGAPSGVFCSVRD